MCGITGIFYTNNDDRTVDETELYRLREAMHARGPDAAGSWFNDTKKLGLGHRRLKINDLSDRANQPMTVHGRYTIVFNGEIYNHNELRTWLSQMGEPVHTSSDTETLLRLYALKGTAAFKQLRGMYALAVYDQKLDRLVLARDPFGIKPLYYAETKQGFYFASQVKALTESANVPDDFDHAGVVSYFLWGHVTEPHTLYKNITTLPAGHWLSVDSGIAARPVQFDDIGHRLRRFTVGYGANTDNLRQSLEDSVLHHMVSDVPISVFLSAGLDSASLTALVSNYTDKLHSHTLGFASFQNTSYDETPWAQYIADQFHCQQQTTWLGSEQARQQFQQALDAMDQPTIDGINTYFVSQAAAQNGSRVALSGVGADELWGGYDHFRWLPRLVAYAKWLRLAGLATPLARNIVRPFIKRQDKAEKYASLIEYGSDMASAYLMRRALRLPWQLKDVLEPEVVTTGLERLQPLARLQQTIEGIHDPKQQLTALELEWYMRNQLLRDTDWAGMAHSLEIRVPFLDLPFFEQNQSQNELTHQSKPQILRQLMPELPQKLFDRPKTGFYVPIRQWCMGDQGNIHDWQNLIIRCYDPRINELMR